MVSKEFQSDQYDAIYRDGGSEGIYHLPYQRSGYFPLFKQVLQTLRARGSRSVLEVGSGNGAFAHLLADRAPAIKYQGFDFSPLAVEQAAQRIGRPELFFVGDAREVACYQRGFDTIVCTEVLEHIEIDREVVEQWPAGAYCVCSVPNFDAENHVRHFQSEAEVRSRYGDLIEIDRIVRIKKPFLSDISWRSQAQALRWNRYRPARLMAILGWSSFESLGGWFVFTGLRRS